MFDTAKGRALAVALLLAGQAILLPIHAAQPVNPAAGRFADGEDLRRAPGELVGERVAFDGTVRDTAPLVVAVGAGRDPLTVVVTGSGLSPAVGDRVHVFGTLTDPGTVESIDAFAVPREGLWYAWGVSFLAGLWVLARLIRGWRFDPDDLSVRRRETPLSLRRADTTEEDDA
jgi:hypothetical protein